MYRQGNFQAAVQELQNLVGSYMVTMQGHVRNLVQMRNQFGESGLDKFVQ